MKKFLFFLPITLFALTNICSSQQYKYVYHLDKNLASTNASTAVVIAKGFKENGLVRVDYFDMPDNGRFMSAHFIDSTLLNMQGEFTEFYKNGKPATQGDYLNDKKNGIWQKWDTLGHRTDSIIYQEGIAVQTAEFRYLDNGTLIYRSFKDSLQDTFTSASYDKNQLLMGEVFFKGQHGILKRYEAGSVKTDSLYTRAEREASFAGGTQAWIRYLQKNLNANTPVDHHAPAGVYQIIVKFIVATDGTVSDVKAETKRGYGMEKEVIRIIKNGPAWEPAIQYGRKVNAYRRQPVTFMVEQQ